MKRNAEIAMLVVTILWGASFVAGKVILDSTTPLYYTCIRFIGATIILGLVYHNRLAKLDRPTLLAGLMIGVALGIGYILQTVGLKYTTASKAGFITGLFVILVPMLECLINRSKPRVNESVGILLATIGLGVLSLDGNLSIGFGDAMVFLGAVAFSISIILISRFARNYDSVLLTIIQIVVTAVLSLFFAITLEPPVPLEVFDVNLILLLLFTILFGTAVNTVVQNWAQSKISATSASLILVVEPVVAGVFGYFLLGDPIGIKELSGSVMMISGMLITLLVKPQKLSPRGVTSAGTLQS